MGQWVETLKEETQKGISGAEDIIENIDSTVKENANAKSF